MKNLRIILLRIFFSWWLTFGLWTVFPILWLIAGSEIIEDFKEITTIFWNGMG